MRAPIDLFFLFLISTWTSIVWTSIVAADDVINGLKAELFNDQELKQLVTTRIDPNIDWHWAYIRPDKSISPDNFSIRWSGYIKAPVKGTYKLILMGDDGCRLYVDGKAVINEWRGGFVSHNVTVDLTGKPQKITVEYFEVSGGAWFTFWWQPLGAERPSIVPSEVLFPDEENANAKVKKNRIPPHGLVAEYYDYKFKKLLGRSMVYRTEAIWGDWSAEAFAYVDGAARYTGFLIPPKSGRYKLTSYADDLLRVWLDGKPVFESKFQDKGQASSFVELQGDVAYPFMLEFKDGGFWGTYYLHWIPPGETEETYIPLESLYPTKASLPKGIKFAGK